MQDLISDVLSSILSKALLCVSESFSTFWYIRVIMNLFNTFPEGFDSNCSSARSIEVVHWLTKTGFFAPLIVLTLSIHNTSLSYLGSGWILTEIWIFLYFLKWHQQLLFCSLPSLGCITFKIAWRMEVNIVNYFGHLKYFAGPWLCSL